MSTVPLPQAFGEYELAHPLGQGGAAEVFLASHSDATDWVVVKLLRQELTKVPRALQRFEQEAQIAVRVSHPNLIRVLNVGVVEDRPFIAMDLVRGAPLNHVLHSAAEAESLVPIPLALSVLRCVAEGLDALHAAEDPRTQRPFGFVHRDIAPKNIIVTPDFSAVIIDFGIGKSSLRPWQTAVKAKLGSPGYMSPEQLKGSNVDRRTDLFNLGVLAFELLTVEPLLERGSFSDMLNSAVKAEYRKLSSLRPELPSTVERVVTRMLATDPDQRYGSGQLFVEALRLALDGLDPKTTHGPAWFRSVVDGFVSQRIPTRSIGVPHGFSSQPPEKTRIIARRITTDLDLPSRSVLEGSLGATGSTTSADRPRLDGTLSPGGAPSPSNPLDLFPEGGKILSATLPGRPSHRPVQADEAPTLLPSDMPKPAPLQPSAPPSSGPDPFESDPEDTSEASVEAWQHRTGQDETHPNWEDGGQTVPAAPPEVEALNRTHRLSSLDDPNTTTRMPSQRAQPTAAGSWRPTLVFVAYVGLAVVLGVALASGGVWLWRWSARPVEVQTAPVSPSELLGNP